MWLHRRAAEVLRLWCARGDVPPPHMLPRHETRDRRRARAGCALGAEGERRGKVLGRMRSGA